MAAHGETGGARENAVLGKVAAGAADRLQGVTVVKGVLNGSPSVEDAVAPHAGRPVLVHPFFMSDGYFVSKVLPDRLSRAGVANLRVLTPLGMLGELPALVAVSAAAREPRSLMVVGHGSAKGDRSRLATDAFAANLASLLGELPTRCAYLEEAPFFADAAHQLQTGDVVVSYFAGDGSHARDDVPRMLADAGKSDFPVVGPIGDLDGIDSVIVADVCAVLAD
ncbi:MAG: hypothetical protein MJE77_46815 [Proteobacteria bacterium]|nr:hypothetical protein [Pseudomonadota bacterium]